MALVWDWMCSPEPGASFEVYWDSWQEGEDGIRLDPNATGDVHSIRYQNLTSNTHGIRVGNPYQTYEAAPGTPLTTLNIPRNQRPKMGTPFQCF